MSNWSDWATAAALILLPALLGIGCVVAAVALFPKRVPNDPTPPSTGRKVLSVMIGCGGVTLLILALGAGACFGMIALNSPGNH